MASIGEDQNIAGGQEPEVGFVKKVVVFILFLAVALGYYLGIDYVLMVFGQNLPFPYKG
jgi:hypothetical protein